ncbi:MAG: hypothetical protein SVU88_04525 [Candidatus Nanohaloarchaea archaeon]|nr:hypothetical protein [Candidatus Nanohaloarchaea archaeon]
MLGHLVHLARKLIRRLGATSNRVLVLVATVLLLGLLAGAYLQAGGTIDVTALLGGASG